MKKLLIALTLALSFTFSASAQMFTTSPSLLQESSKGVVVTFHADKSGVDALMNLPATTKLYAHTGVHTNLKPSSWEHVVTTWGKAQPEYEFKYVSPNTYQLTIGDDMRAYYGITNENEHITALCMIARTEAGSVQTSDQFLEVFPEEGLHMNFLYDVMSTILFEPTTVNFEINTTIAANIELKVNGSQVASVSNAKQLKKAYNLKDAGSYNVEAKATTATGETQTITASFLRPSSSKALNYPGGRPKMGAVKNSDGSVTFCLAAPQKSNVILVGSWDNYEPNEKCVMNYQDYQGYRYFWTTVSGLDNSTAYPYYYLVDGSLKVGDPYAHLVLDPYNDKYLSRNVYADRPQYPTDKVENVVLAVYKGDIDDYDWKVKNFQIPSHENLNVYELLFRDFTGRNSTADGTVRAAIEKIPYLRSLGINCVELMPIMEFNGNNSWGYNTNFYMAPDKAYGSPDDYKEFIDLCHENGMAVVLDIVFNQSDGLHPWYQMYSIDNNPFYNKYAPHAYSVLNDWKQENPLVQQQWADALQYWLREYNVDGFRFDLVKGLGTSYGSDTEAYNESRIEVTKRLHANMKAVKPDAIHINEHLAGYYEENKMAEDGQLNWANHNESCSQYAMWYADNSSLRRTYAANNNRTIGSTVDYAESHDEHRVAYKQNQWGATAVKGNLEISMLRLGSVAAQLLMTPGSKMIWQFGEVGADENTKETDGGNKTNPKKVVWNYFDEPARYDLYKTYRALLNLRIDNPTLFDNSASCTHVGFTNSLTATRYILLKNGNKEIVVLLNPSATTAATCNATTSLISKSNYQVLVASPGFTPVVNGSGNNLEVNIPANSFCVLGTKNVSDNENIVADKAEKLHSIAVSDGKVYVNGDYNRAALFTVNGVGCDINKAVAPGVYVVVVDGNAYKVVVK